MTIGRIKNPFAAGQYGPFVLEIYDKDQYLIARNDKTIFYKVTPGKVIDYSMDMSSHFVYTRSNLIIRFSPLHSLRKSDTILTVDVDKEFDFNCPDPDDDDAYGNNSDLFVKKLQATCSYHADGKTRSIQIKDPFTYTYEY